MNRKMKDSGVEWIGDIPEGWAIERGKHILTYLERPIFPEAGVVTCFRDGEVTLRANRREDGFTVALKEIGYKGVAVGDLVVHGMDGFAGAIGISDSCGKCSPVLNILDSTQNKRFLMYYLRNMAYGEVFSGLATGIRQRSCDTGWNKLRTLDYVLPPIREQQRIADFLDAQTAEIDASIAKTQESIEEYKKLKQAVITQAVTKGIRPGRAMKDSGVEWIGDIPEEWKAAPVKHYLRLQTGTTPSSQHPEYFNGEIPWYTPGDILDKVELTNSERTLKREAISDGIVSLYPPDSVLIVGIGATLGKTGHIDRPASSNQQITALSPRDNTCCGRYVAYCFKSMEAKLKDFAFYTTLPIINNRTLGQFRCPFPPLPEQQEIAAYLDEKCAAIDTLIEKKQAIITELEAYKKTLIYEYVTGKKEVPTAS